MIQRSNLKITIDWHDDQLFIGVGEGTWSLHTIYGSESLFRLETFDAIMAWLDTNPAEFSFQAFPDDVNSMYEPGSICAVVIGFLSDSVFFGYQGDASFWGGIVTRDELLRILGEVSQLRQLAGSPLKDEPL